MIILGIDPGYALMGWGVIEATGGRMRLLTTAVSKPRPASPYSIVCARCR